jgi:hypothetical protein
LAFVSREDVVWNQVNVAPGMRTFGAFPRQVR